ncbi:MAG: hypothetical protein LBG26_00825 [Treponema sp.]|jgi:hypothetical protein|nr:hypothetical protein [Treponema sp.]
MKKVKGQFATKTSVKAQLNSPLVMRKNRSALFNEKMEPVDAAKAYISRATTQMTGIFPFLFSLAGYFFETFPEKILRGEAESLYYQIGTKDDPIPAKAFIALGIGSFKDQKNFFLKEMYKMWRENRSYWVPTGAGTESILLPPIQVFPVAEKVITNPEELKRLSQIGADRIITGFVMQCYKPLFDGHLNGHRDGFVRQPHAWYAKIRDGVNRMIEADARFTGIVEAGEGTDMTSLNVLKIWEYLALHDNGKGETKNIDVVDMLSHVAPSYLKTGEYLRTECLGGLFNALLTLAKLTHEYQGELDFEIVDIELDRFDKAYALKHGHQEGTAPFMVSALKHRLKAHDNILTLQIERKKRRDHAGK